MSNMSTKKPKNAPRIAFFARGSRFSCCPFAVVAMRLLPQVSPTRPFFHLVASAATRRSRPLLAGFGRCGYVVPDTRGGEVLESEICFMTAAELAARIRAGDLSASEVMEAHLDRIERTDPLVHAIVTLLPEKAMKEARTADERLARGLPVGPLHGLPVAHKDLVPTKGIRTTFGSRVFEDHVPEEDALIVERLKGAGTITLGKTNTPEFGAGSQTYNEVFGETLNPYDPTRTCGGSSGGAAAALACGMLPIADGSDMGGSLRNPASFCNVVDFRPSPGRVPTWPDVAAWFTLSVEDPMAHGTGRCPHARSHLRPGPALAHLHPRAGQRLLPAPGARLRRGARGLEPRPWRLAGGRGRDGRTRRPTARLRGSGVLGGGRGAGFP